MGYCGGERRASAAAEDCGEVECVGEPCGEAGVYLGSVGLITGLPESRRRLRLGGVDMRDSAAVGWWGDAPES